MVAEVTLFAKTEILVNRALSWVSDIDSALHQLEPHAKQQRQRELEQRVQKLESLRRAGNE